MSYTKPIDTRESSAIMPVHLLSWSGEVSMARPSYRDKIRGITHMRVREVLDYDPLTGIFRWKAKTAKWTKIGVVAGEKPAKNGHRYVSLDKADILAGRLAWFWVHGEWPNGYIRYRNGDRLDIRLANLSDTAYSLPNSGFDHNTPEGRKEYQRVLRETDPARFRSFELKRRFGIGLAEYDVMFAKQGGVCAICKQTEIASRGGKDLWLAVDHSHTTGKVRGLLCSNCNRGIGCFGDDESRLTGAIAYLRQHAADDASDDNVVPFKKEDTA